MTELGEALKHAAAVLERAGIPYALGGGMACWARGGPESSADVDLMIKPEDAERALAAIDEAGMRTEKPPEQWLYKAWYEDELIDLIFAPSGLEMTDEVIERGERIGVCGMSVNVMALDDVMATKLLALDEHALDLSQPLLIARALREQIDWPSLRARTAGSPYARAFLHLADELGLTAAPKASDRPGRGRVRVVGGTGERSGEEAAAGSGS